MDLKEDIIFEFDREFYLHVIKDGFSLSFGLLRFFGRPKDVVQVEAETFFKVKLVHLVR